MRKIAEALDALPYMAPEFRATFDLAAKQVRAAGRLDLAARLYTYVVEEDELADMAAWDLARELAAERGRTSYGQWCDDARTFLYVAIAMHEAFSTLVFVREMRELEREAQDNDGIVSPLSEVRHAAHG